MKRQEKASLVDTLKEGLTASSCVAVLHYRGLTDKQLYDFRVALKDRNVKLKIAKNTLIKVAIKGSDLEILSPYLKGPTAIVYANDPVSLAKVVSDTAKGNESLKIQAGYLNKSILSKDAIDNLSKLGSLEEVRASFVGTLTAATGMLNPLCGGIWLPSTATVV
jgi:large subunit ribosomal protein L10